MLIDVPELNDALLATLSAVESAKVCFPSSWLKDSAPAGSPEIHFGCPAMKSQDIITAVQKHSAPVNTKRVQIK